MRTRHVFNTSELAAAGTAAPAWRAAGNRGQAIPLPAWRNIGHHPMVDDRQPTDGDCGRGGMQGVPVGGGSGHAPGPVPVVDGIGAGRESADTPPHALGTTPPSSMARP